MSKSPILSKTKKLKKTKLQVVPLSKENDDHLSSDQDEEGSVVLLSKSTAPRFKAQGTKKPHLDHLVKRVPIEFEKFTDLPLHEGLNFSLSSLGLVKPTQVQLATLPRIFNGQQVIAAAPTGSGKTLCFALPILQQLASDPQGYFALILTPTRELAFQIADQFRAIGAPIKVRVLVLVGGMNILEQSRSLDNVPHVIISTPGRLVHHIQSTAHDTFAINRIKILVMDEADRLLSAGFEDDLEVILPQLPKKRQNLFFSATMSKDLQRMTALSPTPPFVYTESRDDGYAIPEKLAQQYILSAPPVKDTFLMWVLKQFTSLPSIILFVGSRKDCETVHHMLKEMGFASTQLHALMVQERRNESIAKFRSKTAQILVATDVASRGLDIPSVGLVLHYNVPRQVEDYVHRIGRTGRAGRSGISIVLMTPQDIPNLLELEDELSIKLSQYEHNEDDVLVYMNKALKARQVAEAYLETSGFYEKVRRFSEHKKKNVSSKHSSSIDHTRTLKRARDSHESQVSKKRRH